MCVSLFTLLSLIVYSQAAQVGRCSTRVEKLRHGIVNCTNDNYVNSVCTFRCTDEDYFLFPLVRTTKCMSSKSWNIQPPCCARRCPPYARMDLFFLLDSSTSVGRATFAMMKRFVTSVAESFTISSKYTQVAALRYSARVDLRSQIKLNDYSNDKEGLLLAIDAIPYGGSGSMTGQAIQYVGDVLMTPESGDRPDATNVLIVVTDGISQDGVLVPSQELRRRNVLTFAVAAIPPRAKVNNDNLLRIAGSKNGILSAGWSENSFANTIISQVCGHPCDEME